MSNDTLPKLLLERYQIHEEGKIAFRRKKFGVWNRYSWKDYYENVKYMSFGLSALGVKPGDNVAVIGENSPEWYWAELAIQAVGGVLVGIFTDCAAPEVKYFLENSDSTLVFSHDQEQVDKVLEIAADLPRDDCKKRRGRNRLYSLHIREHWPAKRGHAYPPSIYRRGQGI